jgi:hypothetical protein
MTTMGERKVNENQRALPGKIEQRLADLVGLGEFDQGDVHHCRTSYWAARDDWHKILVDCYDTALARQQNHQ